MPANGWTILCGFLLFEVYSALLYLALRAAIIRFKITLFRFLIEHPWRTIFLFPLMEEFCFRALPLGVAVYFDLAPATTWSIALVVSALFALGHVQYHWTVIVLWAVPASILLCSVFIGTAALYGIGVGFCFVAALHITHNLVGVLFLRSLRSFRSKRRAA